jgi:small-conductance mechanosensitive channel
VLGQSEDLLDGEHDKERTAHQLRWLLVRLSWIAWPLLSLVGLVVAWGEMQAVLTVMLSILTFPLSVGGITISLLGIIYSLIILFITHVSTRIWGRLLTERILVNSALAPGVQVSISTISVYLIWLFGILWALNAIGIGTTSIAVAFGALGIGIGFGLQSIFNNFLSGLILLFERPIEVGDVLEVSGSWGVVEKINVRSTVIRTYDNSALIIPNSDIISNQLTNWTFKDVRVRRTIQVGVAYGSDARLVEQCLYEIAEKHARVMTEPAPMVLFSDFGDHALIFKLRVWTLLDYGLSTETDIRFAIDEVFREKQIEIAFPQLDVHLDYALPEEDSEDTTEKPTQ